MNWLVPTALLQTSTDGRYAVKFGIAGWGAFDTSRLAEARELGIRNSDLRARALCEAEEALLMAKARRR